MLRELDEICADRPLLTSELFSGNAYYGMAYVLKKYANLPCERPLKVVIPHGPVINKDYVWESECATRLPSVWCYPAYRKSTYERFTNKDVFLAASPFTYVQEMESFPSTQKKRAGTLFFPHHSTHYSEVKGNFDALADRLMELDEQYQPVTVCIYWRDYLLGHHKAFTDRGLRVVSAGHIFDREFLFRLYRLLCEHRYASANKIGSIIFYATYVGCSFFYLEGHDATQTYLNKDSKAAKTSKVSQFQSGTEKYFQSLFAMKYMSVTEEQKQITQEYLGSDYMNSPQKVREILLNMENADKWRFSCKRQDQRRKLMIPTYYQRKIRDIGRPIYHRVIKLRNL